MSSNKSFALAVLCLAFLGGWLFWLARAPKPEPAPVAVAPEPVPLPEPPPPLPPPPKPAAPRKAVEPSKPPIVELHKELIPKNIEIVRCYYSQAIAQPNSVFGFDINGSGFTAEFQKMIQVAVDNPGIKIKNLSLVTANQIHGEMEIGDSVKTDFVYPKVLIKGLPVFSAQEPFAVVRKGDVLTVFFTKMEENGRAGQFQVITNLDEELFKKFQITPSTPGLEISAIAPHLPYVVQGRLKIGPSVPQGQHGLAVMIGAREAYRRDGMISVVLPTPGLAGLVQAVLTPQPYFRPGDTVQLLLQGSGFAPQDVNALGARVDEFAMGKATFTYVAGVRIRLSFSAPAAAKPGNYAVTILGPKGQMLLQKQDAFSLVPDNWVAGIQPSAPVKTGQKTVLRILGRDMSADFVKNLLIDADEPGINVGSPQRVDASIVTAAIEVSSRVAPGDYWLHLSSKGRKIDPPYGSIIKIEK